jgi:energy-coupling factor transporter ATP-binding protein EcfA2
MIDTPISSSIGICPYPGLRSFTEEESIYFRGRDQQIDLITRLLEKNHFLMLTGASGEGKSSLIYAGLLPNARAGFFKAKYSQWLAVDFRPERNPLRQMASSLARHFQAKTETLETELRRGYAALADIYQSSSYFLDDTDPNYQQQDPENQRRMNRQAANLLLIVDQFEEFFTNPENFSHETPSQDAQIVVNLLLETARLALKHDLPIYIVCTMRSDYIGQCASFRGLPEYIGFSQFFVPRLKRKDIKVVIEEPALLSGNQISHRLSERLVYDLSDGIDQLPILQHALSQIWLAADSGSQEMDLIHYAMVGGMPPHELPADDQIKFRAWYEPLPEFKKKHFRDPSLAKVIEIHANTLYETAHDQYNKSFPGELISLPESKRVVALSFACLTKIDHGRAVRNRMTLDEISQIINMPGFDWKRVGHILHGFRDEKNAFIRPFLTPGNESDIYPDMVLDITHESLIRNWNKLNDWAIQEHRFLHTFQDFKKQMDRWRTNGKQKSYLLPIGPLTYFEDWYKACKPNAGWIARYQDKSTTEDAASVLQDTREFLRQSAAHVRLTRLFVKYGARRIAFITSMICLFGLVGYYLYDGIRKQNRQVIHRIQRSVNTLVKESEVDNSKAFSLLTSERYRPGTLIPFIKNLDSKARIKLGSNCYKLLLEGDKKSKLSIKKELIRILHDEWILALANKNNPPELIDLNEYISLLTFDLYYQPDAAIEKYLSDASDWGFDLVKTYFADKNRYKPAISQEINYAIQNWLSFGTAHADRALVLQQLMYPWNHPAGEAIFQTYYSKNSFEENGRISIAFNGGYHTLASLAAVNGDVQTILRAFDALQANQQHDYFTGSIFNNYTQIVGLLHRFGHVSKVGDIISVLGKQYPTNTPLTVYRNTIIRSGYLSPFYRINLQKNIMRSNKGYFYPTLCMLPRATYQSLLDEYEKRIESTRDADEKNYLWSLHSKRKALFAHKWAYDRGESIDTSSTNAWLATSVRHFRQISPAYLAQEVPVTIRYFTDGIRNIQVSRKNMLIYPDCMDGWFSETYHSDLFWNYLDQHQLLETYFPDPQDLDQIHAWVARAHQKKPNFFHHQFDNRYPLSDTVFERILAFLDRSTYSASFDRNLIHLILANRAFHRGDTAMGFRYQRLFNAEHFPLSFNRYEYLEKTFLLNQVKDLAAHLAAAGQPRTASQYAELLPNAHEKAFTYLLATDRTYDSPYSTQAFIYLDSAFSKIPSINFSLYANNFNFLDVRYPLIRVLSRIGGNAMQSQIATFFRDITEGNKPNAFFERIYGIAREGNFYRALTAMPDRMTENDEMQFLTIIIHQAAKNREGIPGNADWYFLDQWADHDFYYINFLPN